MSSKNVKKLKSKNDVEIKCKIEKTDEVHTLEFYIGNRLDLIKQMFSSLKPKTIKSLAPEFLKESDIDDIEELCLNELLGISTKRLKSIINATDCPSNTDSSDSDVENIEENISLEEISSDSNRESDKKKGRKKKGSKKQKKIGKDQREDKKFNVNGKEVSVLELLELQARARAIRSQLALEPIAKIEVDSEASEKAVKLTKSFETIVKDTSGTEQFASTSTDKTTILATEENESAFSCMSLPNGTVANNGQGTKKRIKLKRNFRKRSIDVNIEKEESNQPPSSLKLTDDKEVEQAQNSPKERSLSPDVLPIIPIPEILCISDSSDDGMKKDRKTEETRKYVKETDEDKLISPKTDAHINDNSKDDDGENFETEANEISGHINKPDILEAELNNNSKDSSYEEGEIMENEANRENQVESEALDNSGMSSIEGNKNDATISESDVNTSIDTQDVHNSSPINAEPQNKKQKNDNSPAYVISSDDENNDNPALEESIKENEFNKQEVDSDKNNESDDQGIMENHEILSSDEDKSNESVVEKNYDSNDHNDDIISLNDLNEDIISLNDDEDIELALEQKQCSENQRFKKEEDKKNKIVKLSKSRHKTRKTNEDESSDSSSDDEMQEKKNEGESTSWNNRWLRSSKVSKIMATSKLGSRLREKILKTKQAQQLEKQKSVEDTEGTTPDDSPKSNSNFKDGSIQQYDELDKSKD